MDYLSTYLDAHLDPEALAAFERHLEGCTACRAYLATYEKTRTIAGQAGGVQMPREMKARLRRFLLTQLTRA